MGMSKKFKPFQVRTLQHYSSEIRQDSVSGITENTSEDELNEIINNSKLELIEIKEAEMTQKNNGNELEIFVPFTGSEEIFEFNNQPHGFCKSSDTEIAILDGKEIVFTVGNLKDRTTDEIKDKISSCIKKIKEGCENLKKEVEEENNFLQHFFKTRLDDIKKRSKTIKDKIEDLGIPERK